LLALPLLGQDDIGPADPSLPVENITLHLQPSPTRTAALQHFLAAQQDPASPDFHRWLTPEQFADRFGLEPGEISTISTWLRSHGFRIGAAARSRIWIAFSGTAGQLEASLKLKMHRYRLNGRIYYANSNEPSPPAEIASLVSGFRGLTNFPAKHPPQPLFNDSTGHHLVPDDVATIYNTTPLRQSGINGAGVTIAVPGGSAIQTSDINTFRAQYNLPTSTPQVILVGSDPGTVGGAFTEADIDLEWSGALAPNASIVYVYAQNVSSAEQYIVDNNIAQVITSSYGTCESQNLSGYRLLAQQAAAQGMTWVASSGDTGPAYCDPGATATTGLTVAEPASLPEVTSVGGTAFNDATGNYWSATNGPNLGSALSYIPEIAWNDTLAAGSREASGGGASAIFPKPLWQNAPGVPADGARDVPDVAFAASPNHDGYEVYSGGQLAVYGGTSVSTPVFAGMVALLNHSLVSRGILSKPGLGNINPMLYTLARTAPSAFHDITQGNNLIPCAGGTPGCANGQLGFFAGPGYDQVTGLGSIDVASLASQWTATQSQPSNVVVTATPNPSHSTTFSLTLSETNGGATTLTSFTAGSQDLSSQIPSFFGSSNLLAYDSLTSAFNLSNLTVPSTVTFGFAGRDPSGRTWSQQLPVQFLAPLPANAATVASVLNGASFKAAFAQGMVLSVFGSNFAAATQTASSLPLPPSMQGVSATVNGVIAPLYYVSPSQINLQVPYGTANGAATLSVSTANGAATFPVQVQANAPGIFALVPAAGKPGDTLLTFITGEGAVSPSIATGATPSPTTPYTQLPAPTASVAVTVGGVNAPIAFAGIPSGLAGVTQINFVIPSGVAPGPQPVIVTIGGISSPATLLTVTQ
jgi:uncharacterized protein (TIGR03437 family)